MSYNSVRLSSKLEITCWSLTANQKLASLRQFDLRRHIPVKLRASAEARSVIYSRVHISPIMLGDVVICREVAEKQAEEIGQSVEHELLYLFVHSMFHLLGYDHMDDESKSAMRKAEEDVLGEFDTAGQKGTEEILGELSR